VIAAVTTANSALTPANQLTLLRMLLIPVLALCVIYNYLGQALLVFCVAAVTDLLDGLIARRTGQNTTLGAWLDPMADKLLLVTMFAVLTWPLDHLTSRLPLWLTVVMISRDVGIVATVAIVNLAIGRRTFVPTILGKIATATFVVTGVITLYANYLGRHLMIVDAAIWASLAITVVSGIHYLIRAAGLVGHS
jgi:cardiolipin synthase